MPRSRFDEYTAEEDQKILALGRGEAPALAAHLGRTTRAINARRAYLKNGSVTQPMHKGFAPMPKAKAKSKSRLPPTVFNRPDFFDEDLETMARGQK